MNDEVRYEIKQGDNGESQPIGLVISWNSFRDRRISLLPRNYFFPLMKLPKLLTMWYCGNRLKNIPPYWISRGSDMRETKGRIQKWSMINKLVKNVEKGVRILNLPHPLVKNWTSRHVLDLYNDVKHLFGFTSLNKRRRLKKIAWKINYNILCYRKGYLVG